MWRGQAVGACVVRSSQVKCLLLSLAGIQTIDSTQALFLPIGASVSLLVMFFFFDSVQVVFTICTAGEHLSEDWHRAESIARVKDG